MKSLRRSVALLSATGLAAVAVAGCSSSSSASSGSASSLTVSGNRLAIVISAPHGYKNDPVELDIVEAEKAAFKLHKSSVTKYKLSEAPLSAPELSDNARSAILSKTAVAYIGEIAPGTSEQTVGITNDLDILQVSPTDTALELGQSTPAVSGAPKKFFQQLSAYGRTFARMVPTSAQEAEVQAAQMSQMKVGSLYVGDDGSDYGAALAYAVRKDARAAGITLTSDESSAGAIFYGASSPAAAAAFFNSAASKDPSAKLFGTSSLDSPQFTSALNSSVKNLYVTTPGFMPKDLSKSGKAFDLYFRKTYGHAPATEAIFGFEAMTAVIRDLASLGVDADSRADVVKRFLKIKDQTSVLGTYSINADGNTSVDAFVWNKLSNGTLVPFKAAS